jgi:hypothetical protein
MANAGDRFGRLVLISREQDSTYLKEGYVCKKAVWKCKCDCGNTKSVLLNSLKIGNSRSCVRILEKGHKDLHLIE